MYLIPSHPLCFLLFVHTYFYFFYFFCGCPRTPTFLFQKSSYFLGVVKRHTSLCGSEVWMRSVDEKSVVMKSGSEVWMTTAIDLKSPLEYFFWASLSYESLSYEPNISVWVSF